MIQFDFNKMSSDRCKCKCDRVGVDDGFLNIRNKS